MICARASAKNLQASKHQCFKNWTGSSSGMEADIIVEGFSKSIDMYGLKYARFIGDGDSNVYKKILDSSPYLNLTVEKFECKNHLLRNMCNKVKEIAGNSKLGNVSLRKVIGERILRLRVAITMSVRHRKNENIETEREKISKLRDDILNAPYHIFGSHENCNAYFCHGKQEKNFVEALKNSGLFHKLMEITNNLADHAKSLLKDANNNIVEQFNSIVAKFVGGKRINYCLKTSYQARCSAAVVSHNSKMPLYQLHKTMFDCSPGLISKLSEQRKKRRRIQDSARRKKIKRRRLFPITVDNSYGSSAEKPDLDAEDFKMKRNRILESLNISQEQRETILANTINQSLSHDWKQERRHRLTASNFGYVCNKLPHTKCDTLVKKILYSNYESRGMKYGRRNERHAIEELCERNIKVKPCGLFIDEDLPFLAASPDGLLEDDGLLEIKCPSSCSNLTPEEGIESRKITFWSIDRKDKKITSINKKHIYFYQIQGQLHISKRKYCLFVVWTPHGMKMEKVERDESFWEKHMKEKLEKFYFDCLLPELADPRYPRHMPIRNPEYILEAQRQRKEKK